MRNERGQKFQRCHRCLPACLWGHYAQIVWFHFDEHQQLAPVVILSSFFFLNNSNTKNEISTANLAQEELVNYFFFFMLLRDAIRLLRCSLFYLSCPFSSSSSFCFTRVLCPVSHREYGVTRARTLLFFFLCLSLTRSSENKTKQKQSKGGNRGTRSMKRGEGRARPSKMHKM